MLKDPQKLAEFGFEQGIGFIPFKPHRMVGRQDAAQG